MDFKWNLVLSVISIAVIITSFITRGKTQEMNQDCDFQQTNSSVQYKVNQQTEKEVIDYWTPERMQNAKPLMPTIRETPTKLQSDIEAPISVPTTAPGSEPQSDI